VYTDGRLAQTLRGGTASPRHAYGYDDQANVSTISSYDDAGTALTSTTCLLHDALGRLVLVGEADPASGGPDRLACRSEADVQQVTARFRYDAMNRRVARQDASGQWTRFVFDGGGQPLGELASSDGAWAPARDYVWLGSVPLAQIDYAAGGSAGTAYYVHVDHLGTPRALTNGTGQTVWSATVLPYGEVLESMTPDPQTGRTVVTNLRLPGQYDERLLGSVGLQGPYYNWNRWYVPGAGRYLELDPVALAGGFNGDFGPEWYGYAGSNPLRYTDPTGLAYFGKRPLAGLPWLWLFSSNPLDDWANTEISHEQLFFEDGKSPANIGFFDDGSLKTEEYPKGFRLMAQHFNDCVMRKAYLEATLHPYQLLDKGNKPQNNCQNWAEDVRKQFDRLMKDQAIRKECGL
jgi:RHS repeat-associated protein